jgi:hypothetical protein
MFGYYNTAPPDSSPIATVNCNYYAPQAFTAGGCQVAMGDGSVRSVATSVTATTWAAALTPSGHENLPSDWDQ